MDYPYSLKQIAEITGRSNTALFEFIKNNKEFINSHTIKTGRFIKYDEVALQEFINRFGRVDKVNEGSNASISDLEAHTTAEKPQDIEKDNQSQSAVVEAFRAQIDALKKERDELTEKLAARERDCQEWREQAGQALNALSMEQRRAERLEERLAGYLPAPSTTSKKSFRERLMILFGRTQENK